MTVPFPFVQYTARDWTALPIFLQVFTVHCKKNNEFQVLEISIFNGIKPLYMEYARDNFEYHFAIPRYYHKVFSAD